MTDLQWQYLLCTLGHDPGKPDGIFGVMSASALGDFQNAAGIPQTKIRDAATVQAVKTAIVQLLDDADVELPKAETATQSTGTFWDGIKYFTRDEFRCPCGKCGGFPVEPNERLVRALVTIREHFNVPITIIPLPPANPHAGGSGIRCQTYNDSLSGSVPNSRHVQGKAADIIVRGFSGESVKAFCDSLVKSGTLRYCYVIGGGNSVHVDVL